MTTPWTGRFNQSRWSTCVVVALITLVGAFFRLWDLGAQAFRTDEGNFWLICVNPISAWGIFQRWLELWGSTAGQFPLSMALTKGFVETFNVPVTYFWVRFPSALHGIMSIPIAYGVGRELGGRNFGFVFAAAVAINPYHIQDSRDAYYTAPMVCGSFLGLWSVLWVTNHLQNGKLFTTGFYVINALGFFLLTYAQASSWLLAFFIGLYVLYGVGRAWWISRTTWKPLVIVLLSYLAIGVPLLIFPWALKDVLVGSSPEVREQTVGIFGTGGTLLAFLARCCTSFGWGWTPLRTVFTTAALGLAIGVVLKPSPVRRHLLWLWGYLLVGFFCGIYSLHMAGKPYATRFLLVLLPWYLILLTSGLMLFSGCFRFLKGNLARHQSWVPSSLLTFGLALWLEPAWLCTKIINVPTPYKKITRWVDENLPVGTLILVDRWFEPWCELRTEPATNVFFTYTIPNEPVTVYTNYRWRDTAKDFFDRFPNAGYLEISKSYWEHPAVGPWQWPREYFARHTAFTNDAGMRMRELGLAKRDDYYAANTNRLVVELFYNTTEDVLATARGQRKHLLVLFGSGWGYWKNGQGWNSAKNMDYSDWRVLQDHAQLEIYNLTDYPTNVVLSIHGFSASGAKQVQAKENGKHRFEGGKQELFRVGPVWLPPGQTIIRLEDDLWSLAKVPLLVRSAVLEPARETQEEPAPMP